MLGLAEGNLAQEEEEGMRSFTVESKSLECLGVGWGEAEQFRVRYAHGL